MRKNFNQVTLRYNEQNKIPLPGTGLLTGFFAAGMRLRY